VKLGRLVVNVYFSWSSFFKEIQSSFFAAVKDKFAKIEKTAFTNPTFFKFKIRIPLDTMCCENFGRFHGRKFKIIPHKAIKK